MRQAHTSLLVLSLVAVGLAVAVAAEPVGPPSARDAVPAAEPCHTFSIVAYDPETKEFGVGVASRVLAVGAIVPFAKAGVGAIATQSYANRTYGPNGLKLLAEGKSAEEVIKQLTGEDKGRDRRQVGVIDAKGNAANFTGNKCIPYAGARSGKNYSCQGNLLAGDAVITDMANAFEKARGPLAWRILAALQAADKAGGDKRGKQSAALLVVRAKGGYDRTDDRYIDLRVDDHQEPVQELSRILAKRLPRPKDKGSRRKTEG